MENAAKPRLYSDRCLGFPQTALLHFKAICLSKEGLSEVKTRRRVIAHQATLTTTQTFRRSMHHG